jgi:hypothetical protein
MQTKVLKPILHWLDYELFTTQVLNEKAQAEKIGIISDNLKKYLVPPTNKDPYSLSVNLYACADNPHLYHLTVDIHVFAIKKIINSLGNITLNTNNPAAGGAPVLPSVLVSTHTVQGPPPPPPPPPPRDVLVSTNFLTAGEQYNLVQTSFSLPTIFTNVFSNYANAR